MAAFAIVAQVQTLMGHGPVSASMRPSTSEVESQLLLDAARIRGVMQQAGLATDPTSGSTLETLCAQANAYLTAAACLPAWAERRDGDLELVKLYRKFVEGESEFGTTVGGLLALIASLAGGESGASPSAFASPAEFPISDLLHVADLKF